jgi:hypothetical protein
VCETAVITTTLQMPTMILMLIKIFLQLTDKTSHNAFRWVLLSMVISIVQKGVDTYWLRSIRGSTET